MVGTRVKPARRLKVWVVEDEATFRKALVRVLSHTKGIECDRSFESCEDALKVLEVESAPDIILMDIVLPGMDGTEGTSRIKSLVPAIDIMILTNYDDDDKIFRALCAGASGYLLKTADPSQVKAAIEEVGGGGAPMNGVIARRVLDMFSQLVLRKGEYGLTDREKDILRLLVDGLTKGKIAEKLFLSHFTVVTHLKNIYSKLHVHTQGGVIAKALKERLV
jgi:DNA-binding NarL/FixJ family response regulator